MLAARTSSYNECTAKDAAEWLRGLEQADAVKHAWGVVVVDAVNRPPHAATRRAIMEGTLATTTPFCRVPAGDARRGCALLWGAWAAAVRGVRCANAGRATGRADAGRADDGRAAGPGGGGCADAGRRARGRAPKRLRVPRGLPGRALVPPARSFLRRVRGVSLVVAAHTARRRVAGGVCGSLYCSGPHSECRVRAVSVTVCRRVGTCGCFLQTCFYTCWIGDGGQVHTACSLLNLCV